MQGSLPQLREAAFALAKERFMSSLTPDQYLQDPCRAASIPYWKAKAIVIPDAMKILHQDDFDPSAYPGYRDEPYFRLYHTLKNLPPVSLPEGFTFSQATPEEYAAHIAGCYEHIRISADELRLCMQRPVYHPDLWLVIRDNHTAEIAASGIAELDREVGEGVLEWIQVSPGYRRHGLGRCIVTELLRRMTHEARFATVSGQCRNPSNPELLYRACGFTGSDVWHILHQQ